MDDDEKSYSGLLTENLLINKPYIINLNYFKIYDKLKSEK